MFGPDEIIWGVPPGPGPAWRNRIEEETERANRSWPGLLHRTISYLHYFAVRL
jgi:hypothetical protein